MGIGPDRLPPMHHPEADLPLARCCHQRILELGNAGDKEAEDLQQNLSALAARDGVL